MKQEFNTTEIKLFPTKFFDLLHFPVKDRLRKTPRYKTLQRDILNEGYDKRYPVKLTNTLNKIQPGKFVIMDGQRRSTICVENNIPFYYIMVNENENYNKQNLNKDIIRENNARENFNIYDCLNLMVEESELARVILDINAKYNIKPNDFGRLFPINDFLRANIPDYTNYNELYSIAEKIKKIGKKYQLNTNWRRTLIYIIGTYDNFNIDVLMEQMKKHPELYDLDWSGQLKIREAINKVYNYRRTKDLLNLKAKAV